MTETEAINQVDISADRWLRAKRIVADGWGTQSDRRDLENRLMDFEDAVAKLESIAETERGHSALQKACEVMMGAKGEQHERI